MEPSARDSVRRGVRAAVYRSCWRRFDGDDAGADSLLACEIPAALAVGGESFRADEELVRTWRLEDEADFDRAVLISDMVARRVGRVDAAIQVSAARSLEVSVAQPVGASVPARPAPGAPVAGIADMLESMLAQDRQLRAAS